MKQSKLFNRRKNLWHQKKSLSVLSGMTRMFTAENAKSSRKHKATLLLPKNNTITWNKIKNTIAEIIDRSLNDKWSDLFLENIVMPVKDGDGLDHNGGAFGPECAGHYVITTASAFKPDVVDNELQPITNPDEIYDGIYAYVSLQFYSYVYDKKPCIGCNLGPIMKISDGEPITRRNSVTSAIQRAFSSIVDVKQQQTTTLKKASPMPKTTAPPVDQQIDTEIMPWDDDSSCLLSAIIKKRALTLDEMKKFAEEQKVKEQLEEK